jgi:hypothetical protein
VLNVITLNFINLTQTANVPYNSVLLLSHLASIGHRLLLSFGLFLKRILSRLGLVKLGTVRLMITISVAQCENYFFLGKTHYNFEENTF